MLSEKRKGRVTGSSVGAILGVDPNRTREDVLRAMVRDYHGAEKEIDEFAENVIFAYGKFHEAGARQDFEMETGLIVSECGFFVHPEHDWLGATPDGLVGSDAVLEIKCPWGKREDKEPVFKTAEEQPHYYAQMQIEMACACRRKAYFYQWAPRGSQCEVVLFDPEWLPSVLPALRAFYEDYLRAIKKPDEHLAPRRQVVETPEARALLEEYDDLSEAIDRATERKKEVLSLIVAAAKEKDSIVCGRAVTKVERAGAVSYANVVRELLPKDVDLEPYRGKPTTYWQVK